MYSSTDSANPIRILMFHWLIILIKYLEYYSTGMHKEVQNCLWNLRSYFKKDLYYRTFEGNFLYPMSRLKVSYLDNGCQTLLQTVHKTSEQSRGGTALNGLTFHSKNTISTKPCLPASPPKSNGKSSPHRKKNPSKFKKKSI